LITVSRRPAPCGAWLEADLADPAVWRLVSERVNDTLTRARFDRALLLHFAGTGSPHAITAAARSDEYTAAVMLNNASGPVIGQAFVAACARADVPATVVLCSSPGAASAMAGMSHYGSGKRAMEYWVQAVTAEQSEDPDVCAFAVVPYAVDTPMVREVIAQPQDLQPVSALLREAADRGELATAQDTAREIWQLVVDGIAPGAIVPVGAVPPHVRAAS
jgi:short-subunit dehydrogenase